MVYVANECELNPTFCKKNNLFEDSSLNEDSTKKGYFNKYGRVRIVKLRGQASLGIFKWDTVNVGDRNISVTLDILSDYVNPSFD